LPRSIRGAWYDELDANVAKLGRYAWVEEVFAMNDDGSEGYVVIQFEDQRGAKVDYAALDDGGYAFDLDSAEEIEQEWVKTGKALTGNAAQRMAALATHDPARLEEALTQSRAAKEAADEDPVADFYKMLLDEIRPPAEVVDTA
jgi:hypothetical protein